MVGARHKKLIAVVVGALLAGLPLAAFDVWLDQSIEARHPDLAMALLSVFVEAQQLAAASSRPSVPSVQGAPSPLRAMTSAARD